MVELTRRVPLPETQTRPATTPKWRAQDEDLEELVRIAIRTGEDIGARSDHQVKAEALAMSTSKLVIDERARWKCMIPLCFGYGSSPNCPPHSPTAEQMREIVGSYHAAILMRYMPPVADHTYPAFLVNSAGHVNAVNEMVGIVEAEAAYMGYYLAMGFKGGPCCLCGRFGPEEVAEWIDGKPTAPCPALRGQVCNHYNHARPALEACGVDVFATAHRVGWETWVIQPEHPTESVPCVSWYGLVLVA
jgi:predicted metal-binding protein